ncbi:hypothetical protein [Nonomuraea sp. NPDC049709]|uniref:hypothetical protein n=1 Tax=Nonomuraea sp. NPDC049709 TaxID=3154736 RepID=UPI00341B74FB
MRGPGRTGADRVFDGLRHLAENIHRVPAFVIPGVEGRTDRAPVSVQAGAWGSILPAVWSFMLAAFIPLAYTLGTDFRPARRIPREEVLHWDRW